MSRWSVDVIGKRLQHLGTVVADDERKALEEAIKQFAVRPALRSKIAVTKVADNDGTESPDQRSRG
jgi:1,2-phenylacetyl-CoA epoxidase PaaB subunit